ncbi:MAG: DUF1801 domain-containing protein [Actinomycetes bacterium]
MPKTVIDEWLDGTPEPQLSTLLAMREIILAIVPAAQEVISYNMPAFKMPKGIVAGFLPTKKGCSFYPFSGSTLQTLADELVNYSTTKAALHFAADKPLPKTLVRKLISARMLEIELKA